MHKNRVSSVLSTPAVDALYIAGIKVHCEHFRKKINCSPRRVFSLGSIRFEKDQKNIAAKGGKTIVTLVDLSKGLQWEGVAQCHNNDHYDRRAGINLAFEDAVDRMRHDAHLPTAATPQYAKPVDVSILSPDEVSHVAGVLSPKTR